MSGEYSAAEIPGERQGIDLCSGRPNGFRLSIRSLMVLIALVALLLAPFYWTQRELSRRRHLAAEVRLRALQAEYSLMISKAKAALPAQPPATLGDSAAGLAGLTGAGQSELKRLTEENEALRQRIEELEKMLQQRLDTTSSRPPRAP